MCSKISGVAKNFYKKITHWYERYEKRISVSSLVVGFFIDSLTLQSIDNLWDNLWIAFNLLVAGLCIILLNRGNKESDEGFLLPNILQFSFGALFGSIFVFYLRSSTLSATWPFLAVILFAILFNEFFQKRYSKLAFRLSFLYFATFSTTIFLLPILFKKLDASIFVLSGLASLLIIWFFLRLFSKLAREKFLQERTHIGAFIIAIYIGINALYFSDLIPPIPLSLKESAIYYQIEKGPTGDYYFSGEKRGVMDYFTLWPKVKWQPGEALNAYTAIFAPANISLDVYHDWQYQNEQGDWVIATRIPLHLSGGRAEGFRTYSTKYNFTPGKWRVDVKTTRGQIIGRLNFQVVSK